MNSPTVTPSQTKATTNDQQLFEIDRLLTQLDKLHSSPAVALQVMDLTRDPEYDMAQVAGCLDHDPALAASILRLVNSSYYGLSEKVTNLPRALAYLGRRPLRLAVLSFGLVKTLVSGAPARFHQMYWKRSLTMAAAARRCARMTDDPNADADTAFAAGLLADLGMLVVAQLETDRYVEITEEPDHVVSLVQLERTTLGFDHIAVGQRLLTKWDLPEELIGAVANHHVYLPISPPLNQVLLVSNLLTEVLWNPASTYMQPLQYILQNRFGMDLDDLISLAVDTQKSVEESMQIFDVRLDGQIDLDETERQAQEQFQQAALESDDSLGGLETLVVNL